LPFDFALLSQNVIIPAILINWMQGKKHGVWKEFMRNLNLPRYEGFEHGKEIEFFNFFLMTLN
jgi:hypothetical protein